MEIKLGITDELSETPGSYCYAATVSNCLSLMPAFHGVAVKLFISNVLLSDS